MNVIEAPADYIAGYEENVLFLAGSIEMGAAEDWQAVAIEKLLAYPGIILNPRRADWDSSWKQEIGDPKFREQVEWELGALEAAGVIGVYLSPGTKSPISLLELGLFHRKNMVVCCPQGFWRKGNVDIVCERYGLALTENFDDFIREIIRRLNWREQP